MWAPYLDEQSDEIVYGPRGTNIWDMEQVLSNYVGDECVFPAIRVAVSHICHVVTQELRVAREDLHDFKGNIFQIEENRLGNVRDPRQRSIVLTGHSLGGQAVQYLAAHPPQACLSFRTTKNTDNAHLAYAFASTRNSNEDSRPGEDRATIDSRFTLRSYLVSGDEVLERLNLGNEQSGTVITYESERGYEPERG